MPRQRRSSRTLFFFSGIIVVILFGGMLAANGKKWYDRNRQEKEIKALEEEITRLKDTERQKRLLLEQLQSPFFIEREGREKFGVKKPGETVVLFPKSEEEAVRDAKDVAQEGRSFLENWIRYFFHTPM